MRGLQRCPCSNTFARNIVVRCLLLLLLHRYYANQRATGAISSNMVKDELKRHSRMTKQLAEEQRVLEDLYKVSTWLDGYMLTHLV